MFYYLDFECNLYIMDHFPGSFSVKRARGAILSGLYPMKLAIFKIPGCLIFKQSFPSLIVFSKTVIQIKADIQISVTFCL